MNDIDVCFIAVAYNSEAYIEQCLNSIIDVNFDVSYKIVVVDNASNDSTLDVLQEYKDNNVVDVITNKDNLGFGVANNIGRSSVKAKYYFLLNVDAYFNGNFLIEKTLSVFERDPEVAIVGPRLVYPDGSAQTTSFSVSSPLKWAVQVFPLYHKLKSFFLKSDFILKYLSKYSSMIKSYVDNHHDVVSDYSTSEVDWVSGAALVVRGEYIDLYGMFDENIFLYGEDEDLCLTARKNGWKVCVQNTDPIVHVHGWNSTSKFNPVVARMKYDSLRYFISKWFSGPKWIAMRLLLPVYVYGWRRVFRNE